MEPPCGTAVLVATPGQGASWREQRAQGGTEGTHTQEPKSSSGLENLIISLGLKYLPSNNKQPQPRNAGGKESKAETNRKP